jgi:hypothetical protein
MATKLITAKIYDRVKGILQQYPKTRESDNALMASLWFQDTNQLHINLNGKELQEQDVKLWRKYLR